MQNVILSLLMNGLMAALLIATLVYCRRLNVRIKALQDGRSELARIIREFDESTERATQNIAEIHEAAYRISENIQHKIDKANYLADDLDYMIEKGQKLTGKAEMTTPQPARGPIPGVTKPSPARSAAPAAFIVPDDEMELPSSVSPSNEPSGSRSRSRAEQAIMSALGTKPKA